MTAPHPTDVERTDHVRNASPAIAIAYLRNGLVYVTAGDAAAYTTPGLLCTTLGEML